MPEGIQFCVELEIYINLIKKHYERKSPLSIEFFTCYHSEKTLFL